MVEIPFDIVQRIDANPSRMRVRFGSRCTTIVQLVVEICKINTIFEVLERRIAFPNPDFGELRAEASPVSENCNFERMFVRGSNAILGK